MKNSPKLKNRSTLNINFHETESKAFSKSSRRTIPALFWISVCEITSYKSLVFSPIKRPAKNPFWFSCIRVFNTVFSLFAIIPEKILYVVFSNDIGRQFCNNSLGLFPFGIMETIPNFCEVDSSPFLILQLKDLIINKIIYVLGVFKIRANAAFYRTYRHFGSITGLLRWSSFGSITGLLRWSSLQTKEGQRHTEFHLVGFENS